MHVVACSQLSQRFGRHWILRQVDLCLPAGARLLLTGGNGAGKTTLLRILATALRPSRGQLTLFGRAVWPHGLDVRHKLALMTHQHFLYEGLDARDNLDHVARLLGQRRATAQAAALARVGLADVDGRPVAHYSAGMKRRLALARLLLIRPALLLLDEPYAQLDTAGLDLVHGIVEELAADGATVVMASHDVARSAPLCTHQLHLTATEF